jgi:anti-anti-sigma factor
VAAVHPPQPYCETSIGAHIVGHRTVLAVAGEIDLQTAPALAAAIDEALAAGAAELWVDLTATQFMDSSGLHALVTAHRRIQELNRRLAVICRPGQPVRRLFEIVGAADVLPLYDDRAAAHRAA